jgi:alpha,alpha-trehalase
MVLEAAKKITVQIKRTVLHDKTQTIKYSEVQPALDYIEAYWHKLERYHPKDDENLIGLPNKFLVPSYEEGHEFDYNELYYWDSYFMVQGLMDEKHRDLSIGILENLTYLFNRFKVIPNASRLYLTSRSQPPFLTTFIWQIFDTYKLDKRWLKKMMKVAEAEYNTVWMGTKKPNARQAYKGLSRYYDFNYLHDIAEAESGWDMTPRFGRKALNYIPVDLNALLYKYEVDFARYYKFIGKNKKEAEWLLAAKTRKKLIDGLMWSKTRGLFYDYNYHKEKRGTVSSLASFFPMWAGMVDKDQARQLVKSLKKFEETGGLATTDFQPLDKIPKLSTVPTQWAYPNGWAPLHLIVIEALERYGYHDEAKRIAVKWLVTNLDWFNKHGVFLEKYNVVNPSKPPQKGLYPSQTGFGWTNSVFTVLAKKYAEK